MRRVGVAALLGVAVVGAAPSDALAWHDDGHRIVGEIAARNLSKSALAQINELLADMPEYSTMATAATWADQQAKLDPSFAFAYSSHYINVDARSTPREVLAQCLEKSGCVATGITYYADILRSERASRAQRAEALRFLLHFVGDVHQPLHAGHSQDKGGNDIAELRLLEYTPAKQRTNLHAVWDGGFVAITMAREGWDWQRYAAELDARVTDEMIARWGRGSVYDWIEESRLFAAANGYLRADGMTPVRSGDALGEDWYQRNLPVAEQRLQQAGVRLALVLEELF
ncbi:S1/P1 Nuclease [Enhygromyxa salina]|uniref:S1/P1 Nuclease n=1 Tax=Enhygromyxa salina TaxID=215803 RepID=A0A2S9YC77_9BACT|nr:S1/P1 Nuclease [Enhygromyxa salina]